MPVVAVSAVCQEQPTSPLYGLTMVATALTWGVAAVMRRMTNCTVQPFSG